MCVGSYNCVLQCVLGPTICVAFYHICGDVFIICVVLYNVCLSYNMYYVLPYMRCCTMCVVFYNRVMFYNMCCDK